MEEIGQVISGYLEAGGEDLRCQMIEQEVGRDGRAEASEMANLKQRRTDIEAAIDSLLDNLTPTNRDFVDRRIEKLRAEVRDDNGGGLRLPARRTSQRIGQARGRPGRPAFDLPVQR